MTKPVLPPCSVRDCKRVAVAVVKCTLLCGEHGVAEIEKLKLQGNKGQHEGPVTPQPCAGKLTMRNED